MPTLVQLLKDIETSEEIIEYVQPYIGSVTKAREFARDFIVKRKQLANVEVCHLSSRPSSVTLVNRLARVG